ncbi:hypothetical protein Tsubulata_040958 [Turnera subulata]|uniref:Pentatricopeptide repeat-containing protein n=1 Tax=Turnera subulata TaxID=218843 RepID=A0A9Q0GEH1_9ROSI|nr:hypothetical protein Tsubulata_040958 [Turnera subulata]
MSCPEWSRPVVGCRRCESREAGAIVLLMCLGSMRILWLVLSSLFHMYVQLNRITEARRVFDRMPQPDVVTCSALVSQYARRGFVVMMPGVCNALITGLSRNGLIADAMGAFRKFKAQGLDLIVVSWTSMVAGCFQNGKDIEADFPERSRVRG